MDIDLFQGILLGLLAFGLIVLIALLSTLGGIRKALERGSGQAVSAEPTPAIASSTAASEPARTEPEPVAAAAAVTPAAQEPAPTAAAATPAEDTQAATIRSVLAQHGVSEAEPAPETQTTEPASVVAAHIDSEEPEEEPFQRDGRWWFKRGGELLVYNEGTAQWEPAERPGHWAGGTTTATPVTSAAAATPTVADTSATTPQPAVATTGSGWKCPSCGAINGSTAASCRMCFTARP